MAKSKETKKCVCGKQMKLVGYSELEKGIYTCECGAISHESLRERVIQI